MRAGVDDPATIDVMIVYTPADWQWTESDGHPGIDNNIALALENVQVAADNTHTGMTFRLVHSAEVAYSQSGSSSRKDLDRLTDGSGPFQKSTPGGISTVPTWWFCSRTPTT